MDDENHVPVSLVWRRSARKLTGRAQFPGDILRDLELNFEFCVSFSSTERPTILATIPEKSYDEIASFLEKRYPRQIELGLFY